ARLTLWYSAFSFLLILGCTAYLYVALARNLEREDDGVIQDQIRILQMLLRQHPEDSVGIRQEVELESGARQHARIFIRILDEEGRVVAETPGMARKVSKESFPSVFEKGEIVEQGGESFRVTSAGALLGAGPGKRTLQVALDRHEEEKLL